MVLPFVMIFLFTMSVMVFTQKQSYKEMVSDVSARQLTSLTDHVHQSLSNFLEKPFHANLSLSHNIGYHHLYQAGNLSKVQDYILYTFSDHFTAIPQLDVIGFGSEDGNYVGFRKEANNGYTLMVQDERTNDQLVIYRGSKISEDIRSVISGYDPRVCPWYTPVATQKRLYGRQFMPMQMNAKRSPYLPSPLSMMTTNSKPSSLATLRSIPSMRFSKNSKIKRMLLFISLINSNAWSLTRAEAAWSLGEQGKPIRANAYWHQRVLTR